MIKVENITRGNVWGKTPTAGRKGPVEHCTKALAEPGRGWDAARPPPAAPGHLWLPEDGPRAD